ncbi:cryptochrome/deoxyribodipyrimidine photo-lyase family protein [Elioraea rosea]|uniref:cryptochrome/deoxyribodipyrimidine photo-lyase family protein n=1 Tax=Elioraea rosea TaxID=2492390 RepID=UPI00118314CF|nr:FAD-binding domain-containing protein [Elioraea rosea]
MAERAGKAHLQAMPGLSIVWFKRDLRVADHAPLAAAAAAGPVLPLWIVEPGLWAAEEASARQYLFQAESAAELCADLAVLGQPLVVRAGEPLAVLSALAEAMPVRAIHAHQESTGERDFARDRAVRAWAREAAIPFHEHRQNGAIRALPSRDGWAARWERFTRAPVLPAPATLAPLGLDPGTIPHPQALGLAPDPCPGRQRGGRRAAEALLWSFLADRALPYRRAMSSPLAGWASCSRLSPHLAAGTLSVREAAQAARRARDGESGGLAEGIDSFLTRLAWHCHFIQKIETEPAIERSAMHPAYAGIGGAGPGEPVFEAWAAGRTGWPFLDACMRCLVETGWLNFRARAMLVSVAAMHLGLDWRAVGLHLARLFTDYEPGIHWSQVQMQSGVTGVNTIRMYNPVKQGFDQDPEGAFVRRWVPELRALPGRLALEPWRAGGAAGYPAPIGDHEALARAARERLWGVRHGPAYRAAADAVQARHGSRRSGMRQVGSRRPPAQPRLELGE